MAAASSRGARRCDALLRSCKVNENSIRIQMASDPGERAMVKRRGVFECILLAVLAASAAAPATAQNFPTRSIRLIVPYAPGGIVDYVGRLMGQRLSEGFGQNVIVDNRPGAGGVIGIETASRANADGHTLVLMDP